MKAPWSSLIVRSCPHQAPASKPCDTSPGLGELVKTQQQLGVLGCPSCVGSWPTGKVPSSEGQGAMCHVPGCCTAGLQLHRRGTGHPVGQVLLQELALLPGHGPWQPGPAAGFTLGMLKVTLRTGDKQSGAGSSVLCDGGSVQILQIGHSPKQQQVLEKEWSTEGMGQRRDSCGHRAVQGQSGAQSSVTAREVAVGQPGGSRGEAGHREVAAGWRRGSGGCGNSPGLPRPRPLPGPGRTRRRRSRGAI